VSRFKHRKPERGALIRGPQPSESEPPDDLQRPKFCLEHLVSGFSVLDCNKEQKAAFADRLREISCLSWRDLRNTGRHEQGYETISHSAIRVAIPGAITEDVRIIAFRFWDQAPLLGFRNKAIFHIVWLDPRRQVYRH